jgi:hypothetical protein
MIDTHALADALWELFRDDIASGDPVFFCFHREILGSALEALGLSHDTVIDGVCAAARTCFDVDGQFVSIRPAALEAGPSGNSLAILLVCQQVLAVEEMESDGLVLTENAYFPRLRSLMSPQLAKYSANPFRFEEFERIWRTFSREIRRIPGSSENTVTFRFDTFSGIDKARHFPLSQALLSRNDLRMLARYCRKSTLLSGTGSAVWTEIRRARGQLSRRGQRLVNMGSLRERIIGQLSSFSRTVLDVYPLRVQGPRLEQGPLALAVTLEVTDWIEESYRPFCISKTTSEPILERTVISSKLDAVLFEREYVFCVAAEFGDYWEFADGTADAPAGVSLLVVGSAAGLQRAAAVLDGLDPPVPLDSGRTHPLEGRPNCVACPVDLPTELRSRVVIRGGRLVAEGSPDRSLAYVWMGGVRIGSQARKYLRDFLPTHVRFGDTEYQIEDMVGVNGSGLQWAGFCRVLESMADDGSFDIRFPNGRVAKLSVGVRQASDHQSVGFLVDVSTGFLSPTLEPVSEGDPAVVGYQELNIDRARPASFGAIVALLEDLSRATGTPATEREIHEILSRIFASLAPNTVKEYIVRRLRSHASIRRSTLSRLGIVDGA